MTNPAAILTDTPTRLSIAGIAISFMALEYGASRLAGSERRRA